MARIIVLQILALSFLSACKGENKDTGEESKVVRKHTGTDLTGNINGHDWVDLGLPSGLRWATCNVGASVPEEFGYYIAWGETEPKDEYTSINSLTYKVPLKRLKQWGIIDQSGTLTKVHDAACVSWGEPWRMPTIEDYTELLTNCTWTFSEVNGVNGYTVTGPNHQHIFLPAAAFQQNTKIENVGDFGDYWSSTIVEELSGVACSLGYSSKSYGRRRYARYAGRTIRPVTD